MSIQKIIERIKMIEDNDFTLNEYYHNLSPDEVDTLANMKTDDRKGFLKNLNKADMHSNNVKDLAYNHFANSTKFGVDEPSVYLNNNYNKTLNSIFTVLKNNNILPKSISPQTFKPINPYIVKNNIKKKQVSNQQANSQNTQTNAGSGNVTAYTTNRPTYNTSHSNNPNLNYLNEDNNQNYYQVTTVEQDIEIYFDNENQDNLLAIYIYLDPGSDRKNLDKAINELKSLQVGIEDVNLNDDVINITFN